MKLKDVIKKEAEKGNYINFKGYQFALVGWKSRLGIVHGPFLMTLDGDIAVEIDNCGTFLNTASGNMPGYCSWIDKDKKKKAIL